MPRSRKAKLLLLLVSIKKLYKIKDQAINCALFLLTISIGLDKHVRKA